VQGIGVSEEDSNTLLEPFRRVGAVRQTVPRLDLGLFGASNEMLSGPSSELQRYATTFTSLCSGAFAVSGRDRPHRGPTLASTYSLRPGHTRL
jgi:hypothetical protein